MSSRVGLTNIENHLKNIMGVILAPFNFRIVPPKHVYVTVQFGKFDRVMSEGLRWTPLCPSYDVFIGMRSTKLSKSKVTDAKGNPIIVSAIFNWKVIEPVVFALDVEKADVVVENICEGVLKSFCSHHTYDELRSESESVSKNILSRVNSEVNVCGCTVESFNLTDLSYSSDVASQMLMKQQAIAYGEAKMEIVNSALEIVKKIEANYELSYHEKTDLLRNVTTIMLSNNAIVPTMDVTPEISK